jgi:hypothetical protein
VRLGPTPKAPLHYGHCTSDIQHAVAPSIHPNITHRGQPIPGQRTRVFAWFGRDALSDDKRNRSNEYHCVK